MHAFFYWSGLLLWGWFALVAALLIISTVLNTGRGKRPGYIQLSPDASGTANPTTAVTLTPKETSTASSQTTPPLPTVREAFTDGHAALAERIKIGSPSPFISATVSGPGDHTTDAENWTEYDDRPGLTFPAVTPCKNCPEAA